MSKSIVWFSWKDKGHPLGGGAEKVTHELLTRLVDDGHDITLITADYAGSSDTDLPYKVLRAGSRYTVHARSIFTYRKYFKNNKPDLVVDEVNTAPFFARFYTGVKTYMFFHQLSRQIWFYELPKYLGWIGYVAEPVYLRLLSRTSTITVSQSTKDDLARFGFKDVQIIPEARSYDMVKDPSKVKKYTQPSVLIFGAVRSMKRTLDGVKAFEIAKMDNPNLRLNIAGDMTGAYASKLATHVAASQYVDDITIHGFVSKAKALELYQRSHFLLSTAVKEGWGLTVSDAASQGTLTVAYDVDGLRDSVADKDMLTEQSPIAMAKKLNDCLADDFNYTAKQKNAWARTADMTYVETYNVFKQAVNL